MPFPVSLIEILHVSSSWFRSTSIVNVPPDAMASGGTLTIDVDRNQEDETCRISIKDTGKGIPQDDIDKIFDPFYTTPEKGVGLGLPLSKKIIEGHGGKITVSSVLNEGTTVTVTLPSKLTDKKQED